LKNSPVAVDRVNHENPYANTILLDVYRWSDFPEVKRVCEDLVGVFMRKGHSKRQLNEKFRRHLRVIVLNLYQGYLTDPSLYIAYARDKNVYATRRYKEIHISYRPLIRVIDGLVELGLIEQKKGFYDPTTEIGFQSVIRATIKLIGLIESSAVAPFMIGRSSVEPELIVLRDSQGIEIDYEHQDSVEQMRENLRVYNTLLKQAKFHLSCPSEMLPKGIDWGRISLHRVFNNGSFEEGGRFYGGWWQEMPKEVRKHIEIDGEGTVELDYSGMHLRMLYAKKRLDFIGDPYSIYTDSSSMRPLCKLILLVALNASSLKNAVAAIRKKMNLDPSLPRVENLKQCVKDFVGHHSPVSEFFFTGIGVRLQNIDAQIAERVMLELTGDSIPVLPIHDSFICAGQHRNLLKGSMIRHYRDIVGYHPVITSSE
jgi:hypothetical protein